MESLNFFGLQSSALRAIGNIVTGNDDQTQTVLDSNALRFIPNLLTGRRDKVTKEACWVLSNIAAGNQTQVQAIIDHGLIPMIIQLLDKGDFNTQKECAWIINNISISGTRNQILLVVQNGAIGPFCQLLGVKDSGVVLVVLDGLDSILRNAGTDLEVICQLVEECGALDKIEALQNHENEELYQKAYHIIETYFSSEVKKSSKY